MEINKDKFSHGMKTMLNGMAEVFDSLGGDGSTIANAVENINTPTGTEKNDAKNPPRTRQRKQSAADTAVSADDSGSTDEVSEAVQDEPVQEDTASDDAPADTPADTPDTAPSITLEDITKVIVAKLKKNRKNNATIEQLVKAYKVSTVSELPREKYEAFLTDLSEV